MWGAVCTESCTRGQTHHSATQPHFFSPFPMNLGHVSKNGVCMGTTALTRFHDTQYADPNFSHEVYEYFETDLSAGITVIEY